MAERQLAAIWKIIRYVKVIFNLTPLQNRRLETFHKWISRFLICSVPATLAFMLNATAQSENIPDKIMIGMTFLVGSLATPLSLELVWYKEDYEACLRWCEKIQAKYSNFECFKKCKKISILVCKAFICIVPAGNFLAVVASNILFSCLIGKFNMPPLTAPALDYKPALPLATLIQASASFTWSVSVGLTFGLILAFFLHFIATLKCMQLTVRNLVPEMSRVTFYAVIKDVVDLHCELIENHNKMARLAYFPFLRWELICYGLFLLVWLAAFFIHEFAPFALIASGFTVIYVLLCWMNESLNDAYEDLGDELYDLKWYKMEVAQRKTLLQIMVMVNKAKLFRVGPFHVLSFEDFGNMLNRVYSYGVFLNHFF